MFGFAFRLLRRRVRAPLETRHAPDPRHARRFRPRRSGRRPGRAGAVNAQCKSCHTVTGKSSPMGPTLKGVTGRKAASAPDYTILRRPDEEGRDLDRRDARRLSDGPGDLRPRARKMFQPCGATAGAEGDHRLPEDSEVGIAMRRILAIAAITGLGLAAAGCATVQPRPGPTAARSPIAATAASGSPRPGTSPATR
ncbi:c-type cytochrome [Caulobacter mirabilis]|uniref:c-type cytochrome n=1 Tax=Caulobacter mirabilis TaxID=69666 RepID=UPI003CCBB42A